MNANIFQYETMKKKFLEAVVDECGMFYLNMFKEEI